MPFRRLAAIDPSIININSVLLDLDTQFYAQLTIQISPFTAQALPSAGAVIAEVSDDRLTWFPAPYINNLGTIVSTGIVPVTANGIFTFATPFSYARVRISTAVTVPPVSPYLTLTASDILRPSIFQDQLSPGVTATLPASSVIAINAVASAGGALIHRLLTAAASDNPTLIKAGVSRLFTMSMLNATAGQKFLKIYNKVSAPSSADTPVMTFVIPADITKMFSIFFGDMGASFAAGLGYRITGALVDADNTALVAGDIQGLVATYF